MAVNTDVLVNLLYTCMYRSRFRMKKKYHYEYRSLHSLEEQYKFEVDTSFSKIKPNENKKKAYLKFKARK